MEPSTTAFGIWSGGRFMHFGVDIGKDRLVDLVHRAHSRGIRTFISADVYGMGAGDSLLGEALSGYDRDSFCLVGAVGHDFYTASRQGQRGYPRFTDPSLRGPEEYGGYLRMAAERSLERLGVDSLDLLLLHNPDSIGYTHSAVWKGLSTLKEEGLTRRLGIAPGPANGFTLDVIGAFEAHGNLIDWAMIILNPLEPWPGRLCLPAAEKHGVGIITRVVDFGGLFHDGLKSGAGLPRKDHRAFRPKGWIESAQTKLDRFRDIAKGHGMTLLQLASRWCLDQGPVQTVVPTLIQEGEEDAKPIEAQIDELAAVAGCKSLSKSEVETINRLGDNSNCMALKGASTQYLGPPQADQWSVTPDLLEVADRWNIVPDRDLYYPDDPRDIREIGAPTRGVPQTSQRRLYFELQAYGGCASPADLIGPLQKAGLESVIYADLNDPAGVALLLVSEQPGLLMDRARTILSQKPFASLRHKPEFAMMGRTYATGHEPDLEDWLVGRPRRNALNPEWPWAIWYPLRRKPEFALLSRVEQGDILREHAEIGRAFGSAGYVQDIRLACHGLDPNDNEFLIGLLGPDLYPLSRIVQEMRKTQQTARYIQSLGPFFVGRVVWQSEPGGKKGPAVRTTRE